MTVAIVSARESRAALTAAFVEARRSAEGHQIMYLELAECGRRILEIARQHEHAACVCLDAASNVAKTIAEMGPDDEAWPPGLEREIVEALESRDEGPVDT